MSVDLFVRCFSGLLGGMGESVSMLALATDVVRN